MKIKLLSLLVLFCSLKVSAINVTIIESLTGNTWAVQDTAWRFVANGMGYNASIVPQSTLDNISNLNSTDVLIVSSANISFTSTNHLQTIRQFVLSGRPAYIQSEYQTTYQGNITFDSLMQAVGANFNWTTMVAGSLVPMNILGTFATTPNNVISINYFNYGFAGTGTDVEAFLEYNGEYFGFCYSDSTFINGTVITTSDEDWAWHNASPALMENILYRLANSISASSNNLGSNNFSVNISPNPFTYETHITTSTLLKNATLTVFSSVGRQVKQMEYISGQRIILRRENLSAGLYFIRLTQDNKIISTDKLVITD